METVGLIGIIIALFVLIWLALKGYSTLILAPLAALIIVITNGMGMSGITSDYMGSVGGMVSNIFLYALLGAGMGKYYEDSGAATVVARSMVKLLRAEKTASPMRIVIAITLISAILSYGGVSIFAAIFALIPIARALWRRTNLPWHIALIPVILGMATFTNSMLPGSPILNNILPTSYLGTTLTAAPVAGIVASVLIIAWGLLYASLEIKKAQKAGLTYDGPETADNDAEFDGSRHPGVLTAYIPMIAVILIVIVGSAVGVKNCAYYGLSASLLLCMLLFGKYVSSHKKTLAGAANNSLGTVVATAAVTGVGSVITASPGFSSVIKVLINFPGGPIVSLIVVCAVFALITGSPSGSIGIVMASFANIYLSSGLEPEVIHRITSIVCTGFGCVPHCGAVVGLLMCAGLTHKEGYKHCLMVSMVGHVIGLAGALVVFAL